MCSALHQFTQLCGVLTNPVCGGGQICPYLDEVESTPMAVSSRDAHRAGHADGQGETRDDRHPDQLDADVGTRLTRQSGRATTLTELQKCWSVFESHLLCQITHGCYPLLIRYES